MVNPENHKVLEYQEQIINYWDCCGRKELPWRHTRDPWLILLTEVLLRKTTAQQAVSVFGYFSNFSPEELAQVDNSELKAVLFPLGMYEIKSHQIRSLAEIVAREGKQNLQDEGFLNRLPGVGRYIRNCVLCFAFGKAKPALDTNMIRVVERVFSFRSKRSRPREDPEFWIFAEELVPINKPREYNWGVLDLAFSICKPKKPICIECPLNNICNYYHSLSSL